jgi:hypothetical protein
MPIQFDCPSCGRALKAPDNTVGKTVKCPHCQGHIQVPGPIYEPEEVPAAPYEMEPAAEAPAQEDRRPCPMCGEMIKVGAVKCRYCGEVFDETLRRAEKRRKGEDRDSRLGAGEVVVAVICSVIGCIVGLVWMIQGKPKGIKMFGLSILCDVVKSTVWLMLQAAMR